MTVQADLCGTCSETPKTGFLALRFNCKVPCQGIHNNYDNPHTFSKSRLIVILSNHNIMNTSKKTYVTAILKLLELLHERNCLLHMQNKDADQLCSNCCTAHQGLCFCFTDSTLLTWIYINYSIYTICDFVRPKNSFLMTRFIILPP